MFNFHNQPKLTSTSSFRLPFSKSIELSWCLQNIKKRSKKNDLKIINLFAETFVFPKIEHQTKKILKGFNYISTTNFTPFVLYHLLKNFPVIQLIWKFLSMQLTILLYRAVTWMKKLVESVKYHKSFPTHYSLSVVDEFLCIQPVHSNNQILTDVT